MQSDFGNYLKSKRIEKQFSLRKLAEKVNVGHTYLSSIENNSKPPPSDNLLKLIAIALNLNREEQVIFYDLAAKEKTKRNPKNHYLPVDIAEYLKKNKVAIEVIELAMELGYTDEFWDELLKNNK